MGSFSFRDFALEQPASLDGLRCRAMLDCTVFASSERQVLKYYREAPLNILAVVEQLTAWVRKGVYP